MSTIPQNLNWVETRAACTVYEVYKQLCAGIEADVGAINAARGLDQDGFVATPGQQDFLLYVGRPKLIPRDVVIVRMEQGGHRIFVTRPKKNEDWTATVGLNNEGRCILRLTDGTELEQWQFRKKALEALFFGD